VTAYAKVLGIEAGEFVRDINDPRLLAALPRDEKETDDAYVARLASHELAVVRDDKTLHAGQAYREAKAEAIRFGVPLLILGGPPRPAPRRSGSASFDLAAYRKARAESDAALPPIARS
jgi:hypothetical protein